MAKNDGDSLYLAQSTHGVPTPVTVNMDSIEQSGGIPIIESTDNGYFLDVYDDNNNLISHNEVTNESINNYIDNQSNDIQIIVTGLNQMPLLQ